MTVYTSDKAAFDQIKATCPNVAARFNRDWNEFQATIARDTQGRPNYADMVVVDKAHDKDDQQEARAHFVAECQNQQKHYEIMNREA